MFVSSAVVVVAISLVRAIVAAPYSNVLRTSEGGDPDIVFDDGYYYMMATNYADLRQTRAKTLEGLKTGETRLLHDPATAPDTARCNIWAPEMHRVGSTWYIYYSAGPCGVCCDSQRSHVLRGGSSPWDAFEYMGQITTPGFSIDGTLLTIGDNNYFVYSCLRSDTGTRLQSLCISPMEGPTTIGEERLLASPTAAWEQVGMPVNEGAYALYKGGKIYLTFSASFCGTAAYSLGLLTFQGGDPLNAASWIKSAGPVFSSNNATAYGTGHNSIFISPDGQETWMAYHSVPFSAGSCGNERQISAKRIAFTAEDVPEFGTAPDAGVVSQGPSGEPQA